MYLPLHNESKRSFIIRIPGKVCFFIASVPLVAFTICVLITMFKDFESANNTHCRVPNIFPSISASIGNYEPQITIWKTAIYFHSPLRFFLIVLRWKYYRKAIREDLNVIINLAVFLNVVENLSLLGLTHWTSLANYSMHEKCFKTFIATSVFYMLIICVILTKYRRKPGTTRREKQSIKLKWRAFIVNGSSFALAAYFFLRHNSLCEPYVYSMFGFFEYIVVVSNIAFHLTTVYDVQLSFIYVNYYGIWIE